MLLGNASLGSVELGGLLALNPISGELIVTLDAVTLAGVGAVLVAGSSAITLDATGLSSDGATIVGGSISTSIDAVGASSDGDVTVSGSLSGTATTTFSGTGQSGQPIGNFTITLDALTAIFRGKVTGAIPPVVGDVPCLINDRMVLIPSLALDNVLAGSGLTLDNLTPINPPLTQDQVVTVPCDD